jgi:hypothetical protein
VADRLYPHNFVRETVLTGCGWPYRCRCGLGSPTLTGNADEQDNCPAAMRDHIAELSRLAFRDLTRAWLGPELLAPNVGEQVALLGGKS